MLHCYAKEVQMWKCLSAAMLYASLLSKGSANVKMSECCYVMLKIQQGSTNDPIEQSEFHNVLLHILFQMQTSNAFAV